MPKRTNDGVRKRCDCPQRNWPKCSHPWHFNFHHKQKEYRFSLDVIADTRNMPRPVTKGDAIAMRDTLRGEIRAGTFVDPTAVIISPPVPADTRLTFGDVVDKYIKQHVEDPTRKQAAQKAMTWVLKLIRATEITAAKGTTVRLEAKVMEDIRTADIDGFRDSHRAVLATSAAALARVRELDGRRLAERDRKKRRALKAEALALRRSAKIRPGVKGGEVGINRMLARLRHVFSWSIEKGYVDNTPFKRGTQTVVRLATKAESARTRRLEVGEEERLSQHAQPHLRALIVAALSTGCRLGELLGLTWGQIRRDERDTARWIRLDAAGTKTNESRDIPIGPRLGAELEMRRYDPKGKELAADKHVFGNEVGEQIASISTAWRATCRRAKITNLHFHDLRREFGCRLLESGASQHDVRDFLGHANITTTSRYLKSTPQRLERALARMEGSPLSDDASRMESATLTVDEETAH